MNEQAELHAEEHTHKISDEFADRLAALPPDSSVRAIVLPAPYLLASNGTQSSGTRIRGEERQARIRETRTRTEEAFAEIDRILAKVGGKRITEFGNALGYIVIETCSKGIDAIADLQWVGTVLEDQAIHPVHQPVNQIESPPSR